MPYKDPEAKRAWRAANRSRNNEYNRGWHYRNPGAQSSYSAKQNRKSWEDGTRFADLVYKYFNENIERISRMNDAKLDANARHRRQWRARAIAFLGGRCEWCGLDQPMCLEIDHIEPVRRRTNGLNNHNSLKFCKAIVRGEETNAQLLCSNCHTIKSRLNKEYGNGFVSETFDPHKGICFEAIDDYLAKHHDPSLLDSSGLDEAA